LCAGYGGLADLVEDFLGPQLPSTKFILPTAPEREVTLNGGFPCPAWYDIVGLSSRDLEQCEGIEESRATVQELVDEEAAQGRPSNRVVLAGGLQGCAWTVWQA
jgi:predicted esterase